MNGQSLTLNSKQRSNTWMNVVNDGGKVVIVFDDFYEFVEMPDEDTPSSWGLFPMWSHVCNAQDTLAVGFFDLPVKDDPQDLENMLQTVDGWFQGVAASKVVTDRIIIVDMFRGSSEYPVGLDVLAAIDSNSALNFSYGGRVGILSVASPRRLLSRTSNDPVLAKYKKFDRLPDHQGLDTKLLAFLRGDDLEERLWPTGTDTTREGSYERWFDDNHPIMKHNIVDVRDLVTSGKRPKAYEIAKTAVKDYVTNALGFPPPEHWFEPPEIDSLWEDLKHLVGSCAAVHVGNAGSEKLTLGNLVLLLGVAAGRNSAALLNTIHWSDKNRRQQILPSQSKDQARLVAKTLAGRGGLFARLSHHDMSRAFLLREVSLTGSCFSIDIDLNMSVQRKGDDGRLSLLDKVLNMGPACGDTYSAFRSFLIESAVSTRGREAKCVLNLLAPHNGNCWKLEIRRCY